MGKAAGKVNGRPKLSRRVESFWLPLSQQKPNKTKKISVFSHRGVGTTPLRAGGRDSVVNKKQN